MRIDKFIWAVRIYKSRGLAAEACRKGRVKLNGIAAKPSKEVVVGDELAVRKRPVVFSYIIEDIPKSRIGAKLVSSYLKDITPSDQLELLEKVNYSNKSANFKGRPTKKDRREIEKFKGDS